MLWISTDITKLSEFKERFKNETKMTHFLDLSKVSLSTLADEAMSIVNHHSSCSVFLGYLEPGWMLDSPSQTILRKLFRKFQVGVVVHFTESLPFSWKNECQFLFTSKTLHGYSNTLDNGSSIQHKPEV
jgi:hypothetical protein